MRVLVATFREIGDPIYLLPMIGRMYLDSKEIHVLTDPLGGEIFRNDARVMTVTVVDGDMADINKALEKSLTEVNPDELVMFMNGRESTYVPGRENEQAFNLPVSARRKIVKGYDLFLMPLETAGYPLVLKPGDCGTMAYKVKDIQIMNRWRKTHQDQFVVFMPMDARFPFAKELAGKIFERYPDAVVYLGGGKDAIEEFGFDFGNGRTYNTGKAPLRQQILLSRFADIVIGPETTLLAAAGMWRTPKISFCTTLPVCMTCNGQENDFSMQAEIPCSPCLRNIQAPEDCYEGGTPCNSAFDQEKILAIVDQVYRDMRYREETDAAQRTPIIPVADGFLHAQLSGPAPPRKKAFIPKVERIRSKVIQYLEGFGLDMGCGEELITPAALGIELKADCPGVSYDLNRGLSIVANESCRFIFSDHTLEHLQDPAVRLAEWWAKLELQGYLILNCRHADLSKETGPDLGMPFVPEQIKDALAPFALYKICEDETDEEEKSFLLVVQKLGTVGGVEPIPLVVIEKPRVLVTRYGGIGDHIMVTPVFRHLKEEGYHVTYNTTPDGREITRHNPYIDAYIVQPRDAVPNYNLEYFWKGLSARFDRHINLSGSIEEGLLMVRESAEYKLSTEERQKLYGNVNYYQRTLELAGFYSGEKRGELFFSTEEENVAQIFRKMFRGRFLVLWALSGSAMHKTYPYYLEAMDAFSKKPPKALFVTVGGYIDKLLEINCVGPNYFPRSGVWGLRQSLIMAKYADLVMGGETGILNAAGCFPTPKICFLTHSSWMNLAQGWENDFSLQSQAHCSPCHKMIYKTDECEKDPTFGVNICAEQFDIREIVTRMEKIYKTWDRGNIRLVSKNIVIPGR